MYRDTTNFTTPSNPVESKPEVFSLEGLIAWLEKQPGDKQYDYMDRHDFLACRYLHDHGIAASMREGFRDAPERNYMRLMGMPNSLTILAFKPYTYGAALTRARQLMKGE